MDPKELFAIYNQLNERALNCPIIYKWLTMIHMGDVARDEAMVCLAVELSHALEECQNRHVQASREAESIRVSVRNYRYE